jgi:hypothetical protein
MREKEILEALELTRDADPRMRRRALRFLCPCAVKANTEAVWDRVLEMAADSDPGVRSLVLHTLCDGSPSARKDEVVAAVASFHDDPDVRLRRRARQVLAAYRRTGRINQL